MMNNLKEAMQQVISECDEIVALCGRQIDMDKIKRMSVEELELAKRVMCLYDRARDLAELQAFKLDDIDRKLDMLLTLQRKED